MDYMVLHILNPGNEIADDPCIVRYYDSQGIFYSSNRAGGMNRGSDPSNALDEQPGIAGIAALQDDLNAPEHGAGRPSVHNFSTIHLRFDSQMSFNPGDRIYCNLRHGLSSFVRFLKSGYSCFFPSFGLSALPIPCAARPAAVATARPAPILSAVVSTPNPGTVGNLL